MTLVSDILTAAYRESNLIPIGATPNTNLEAEALTLLNTLVMSSIGNEVGDPLRDINIGGAFDESNYTINYVPTNVRLVLNLTQPTTLFLNPEPYPGQRLAFSDVGGNIATYNLTLRGNGRNIEGASFILLNTNGDNRQWFYRPDIATWVKIATLLSSDQLPFPSDFDDYFITGLALRLNPRYGQTIAPETRQAYERARRNIRSQYRDTSEIYPEYMGRLGDRFRQLSISREFLQGKFSF